MIRMFYIFEFDTDMSAQRFARLLIYVFELLNNLFLSYHVTLQWLYVCSTFDNKASHFLEKKNMDLLQQEPKFNLYKFLFFFFLAQSVPSLKNY